MGYNSVLVILNDRLDEIERDAEFGKKVASAIREHGSPEKHRRTYVTGQTQVVTVNHADTLAVVAVGANYGRVIGYGHWTQNDDELIRWLERERRRKTKEKENAQ